MYGPTFESDRAISWDELVHEVSAACAAYLLRSTRARRARAEAAKQPDSPAPALDGPATRATNFESEL